MSAPDLHDAHRRRDHARDVGDVGRHDERVVGLREIAERVDVLLGDAQVHRLQPAGRLDRVGDLPDRLRRGFRAGEDRRGLALRVVDLGLLLAFGLRDRRLARTDGDVDLLLAAPFGRRDHRALLALGGDLRLHRTQDLGRRRQVLDLVAQHLHAPDSAASSSAATTVALIWSRSSNVRSSSMRPMMLRNVVCASCVIAST